MLSSDHTAAVVLSNLHRPAPIMRELLGHSPEIALGDTPEQIGRLTRLPAARYLTGSDTRAISSVG